MDKLPRDRAAPLIALDKVVRIDPTGITTTKAVAGNEPFFIGHYPHYPIYPGVFIIEAVHQAVRQYAAIYLGRIRLVEVRSTRFLSPVHPGDVLESDCQCKVLPDACQLQVSAVCKHAKGRVAEVKLNFRLEEERDQPRAG